MENAADALKMAASVLIFVLALTISINAFGKVGQISQIIMQYNDKEYNYEFVEENKDASGKVVTERIVGVETVIPSIYKAYTENYKIVFKFKNANECLYEKNGNKICYIDLEKEVLGNDTQKEQFLSFILYGSNASKEDFIINSGISLYNNNLYGKIKSSSMQFTEKLGVYYQDDVKSASIGAGSNDNTPEANKIKKRVITYIEI